MTQEPRIQLRISLSREVHLALDSYKRGHPRKSEWSNAAIIERALMAWFNSQHFRVTHPNTD